MASTLGWLDHDPHERERTNRILALFKEQDSRDELGLGGIRDSIADQFFPGTSTIQTRLRYMLFVPWIYRQLEAQRVPSSEVARRARRLETELIQPLLASEKHGVLGARAGAALKRLPSSVYWAGLGSWGIRRYQSAQEPYHLAFDKLHRLRAAARRDDDGDASDSALLTWDPALPAPPPSFPRELSFELTRAEADYLRDRICIEHPNSLLAWLVTEDEPVPDEPHLWRHPRRARFPEAHLELVHHAHVFAEVMFGAASLYNLELARLHGRDELVAVHEEGLAEWVKIIADTELQSTIRAWSLPRFWKLVVGHGHTITERARRFVDAWTGFAREGTQHAIDTPAARALVRERERRLKGRRSRFDNARARDQWNGYAGLGLASYRWPGVRVLLSDLQRGLQRTDEV